VANIALNNATASIDLEVLDIAFIVIPLKNIEDERSSYSLLQLLHYIGTVLIFNSQELTRRS
jgi:hypothetical protein